MHMWLEAHCFIASRCTEKSDTTQEIPYSLCSYRCPLEVIIGGIRYTKASSTLKSVCSRITLGSSSSGFELGEGNAVVIAELI